MRVSFLLLTLLAVGAGCARNTGGETPQDPDFVVLSPTLSNGKVNTFAEDDHGHIWIGTFRGLNKFDVHNYHQYFCNDADDGLPDNQVNDLLCDRNGRLWVSTVNGVCRYTHEGRFLRYDTDDGNRNAARLLETPDGGILLSFSDHFSLLDEETGVFRTVLREPVRPATQTAVIAPDGKLWITTYTDICSYDTRTFEPADRIPLPHPAIHIAMTPSGDIWMSGMGGLSRFSTREKAFLPLPEAVRNCKNLMEGDIDLLFCVDDGSMLLNTIGGGIFFYNSATGRVVGHTDPDFPFTIPEGRIRCIFRDSSHNLWFGSEDQGCTVSRLYHEPFEGNRYLSDAFRDKSVVSVAVDRDRNLWISTLLDGLYAYQLDSRELRRVDFEKLLTYTRIGYVNVDKVFPDSKGNLWLLVKNKNAVFRCRYAKGVLTGTGAWDFLYPLDILEAADGDIWLSNASRELYRIKGDSPVAVPLFDEPAWTLTPSLVMLPQERILSASVGAPLTLVDSRSGTALPLPVLEEDRSNCIRRSILIPTDLKVDSSGDVWIGTIANGLLRYTPSTGRLFREEGAPCTDIAAIEEDRQGNVWVSTLDGLGRYDRTSGSFVNYLAEDGIGGNQFYEQSSCILPDGTLVFGGTHGLTVFNPLDTPVKHAVPLVFEDLKVQNRRVQPGADAPIGEELCEHPEIVLKDSQQGFSISFAALDYGEQIRTRYAYMMEGFDKFWVKAGTGNEAYYGNLPPGKYRFRVRITGANKSIIPSEDYLDIRVLPPFWKSWWMNLIVLLMGALLGWGFFRLFRNVIKAKEEKELAQMEKAQVERLNRQQMNFFANIAHEFRTPLTMISGPVSMLERSERITGEDRKLLSVVGRSTNWMLNLVSQMLDFNRLENSKLHLKVAKTDVVDATAPVVEMFRQHAADKGISFTTVGLDERFTMWLDQDKLRKILMNLLSNAMKFTPSGGKVTLSFDVSPQEAQFTVSDTGCGIPEDQLEKIFERYYQVSEGYNWGSGIGLYYARMLAGLHHGNIVAANRTDGPSGAVFTLSLPVSGQAYTDDEKTTAEPAQPTAFTRIAPGPDTVEASDDGDAEKRSILVVDDDVDVANYLKLLLGGTYAVRTCFDADSALKLLSEQPFDVVLSDVVMPGRNGLDLCRCIKSDMQLSHIPVVLVTARATVDDQVEGLGKGADAYVTKPFDPHYLLALIKSLLENRDKVRGQIGRATAASEISEDALSPQDKAFMKELYALMESELSNPDIDIAAMTEMMKISRTKFYYKVKGLTGENPSVFFRRYKLNRAARLLLEGKYNMSEIADLTGFSTLSHFSTSFKKQFGVPPSEYKG